MATIELSKTELRAITAYAIACARPALGVFERTCPDDPRARAALEAAQEFAAGGERTKTIRDCAWAALEAAQQTRDGGNLAASAAARAAANTCSAAYLHPLAKATQVWHILGAAAFAAHALELGAGDSGVGAAYIASARTFATRDVVGVLRRYPRAPAGRGRAGELLRALDESLR